MDIDEKKNQRKLLTDLELADILSVSPSWVRKQRRLRNKGEQHVLTIDPVYMGSSPRYQVALINEWLQGLPVTR